MGKSLTLAVINVATSSMAVAAINVSALESGMPRRAKSYRNRPACLAASRVIS